MATILDLPIVHSPEPRSLVDLLLAEQQVTTAVEKFSQRHADQVEPLQARYYRDLIPLATPQAGEQYAFEVDLDLCSGCKACVTACHNQNGLDETEAWREVGLLHGGTAASPVMQHVTTACHHCLDPGCLNVCPVKAYEKHPVTGIVKHLDDQCIGCQYCVLACPYDVPKYNKQKGIVRKCDMCSDRLASGEAPACVQACPHEAIRITIVRARDVVANCETSQFLPGAPEPQLTLPTTNYKSSKPLPRNVLPADYYSVHREHAHLPLVFMLVLTQLSVGAFIFERWMDSWTGVSCAGLQRWQSTCALVLGLLALGASTLHLGRPQYAFRAVLGLRTSWLSREIVAFGAFATAAMADAALHHWGGEFGLAYLEAWIGNAVVATGVAGVLCSVMVYHRTRRVFWNGLRSGLRFLLTTALLGVATTLLMFALGGFADGMADSGLTGRYLLLCQLLAGLTTAKLLFEAAVFLHLGRKQNTPLKRSARLMAGELIDAVRVRFVCGAIGGIALPLFLMMDQQNSVNGYPSAAMPALAALAFVLSLGGELVERYLFFSAVASPKMPGGLTS